MRDLYDQIEVPDTDLAGTAWDRGRQRRRVRHGVLGGAAVACAASVVLAAATVAPQRPAEPAVPGPSGEQRTGSVAPSAPEPRPEGSRIVTSGIVTRVDDAALAALAADVAVLSAPADAPSPAEQPMSAAALAVGDPDDPTAAHVLGTDGEWRTVRVALAPQVWNGARHAESSAVTPQALSPDGTLLALPHPGGVTVVDLTTGESTEYEAGARTNQAILWRGTDTVYVTHEDAGVTTWRVDLRTGAASPAPGTDAASTRFTDAGEVRWDATGLTVAGRTVATRYDNNGGYAGANPLLAAGVVVGNTCACSSGLGVDMDADASGLVAIDAATGNPTGFWGMGPNKGNDSSLLGLLDGQPVVQVDSVLAVWDVHGRSVAPLARVDGAKVSWGIGIPGPYEG